MYDMTEQNAPERIWADLEVGTWFDGEPYSEGDTEYVRADVYDAAWNEAIEAAYAAAEQYPAWDSEGLAFIYGCVAARDAIRALRREPSK